jgi:hypothetical protein
MLLRESLVGLILATFFGACSVDVDGYMVEGSADAGTQNPKPDGGQGGDGGASGPSITVHGTASMQTTTMMIPIQSAAAQFRRLDGTVAGTATTDTNGTFTFTVPTNGMPVDGFVQIGATGVYTGVTFVQHATTSVPLLPVILFDESALSSFAAASGTNHHSPSACLLVHITGAAGAPLANAKLFTTIGNVRYHDAQTGGPTLTRDTTDASGLVWVFGLPPGSVGYTASAPGLEFNGFTVTLGPSTCAQLAIAAN